MEVRRVFIVAYVLNFVWENAQMPLYAGYEGFWAHVPMHLLASLVDAVVTVFLAKLVLAFVRGTASQLILLAGAGAVTAVIFELVAQAFGMWSYGPDMPVVGGVGLFPFLQLAILVPLAALWDIGHGNGSRTKWRSGKAA